MRRVALTTAVSLAMLAAPVSSSAARVTFARLPGFHSPGTPAKYDKVGVLKIGPQRAPNILVLNSGTSASAAYFAPLPSMLSELFPVEIRTTGMSLAYNIGVTLLGGFAPTILAWLVTYSLRAPSIYYIAVALLSVIGLILARRVFGSR